MQVTIVQNYEDIAVHRKGCTHEQQGFNPNFGIVTLEADSKEQVVRRYYVGMNFDADAVVLDPHSFAEKMGWSFAPCARTLPRSSPAVEEPTTGNDHDEAPEVSDTDGVIQATIETGFSTIYLKQGRKDFIIVRHRKDRPAVRVAHGTAAAMLAALPAIITQEVTNG